MSCVLSANDVLCGLSLFLGSLERMVSVFRCERVQTGDFVDFDFGLHVESVFRKIISPLFHSWIVHQYRQLVWRGDLCLVLNASISLNALNTQYLRVLCLNEG